MRPDKVSDSFARAITIAGESRHKSLEINPRFPLGAESTKSDRGRGREKEKVA